MTERRKIKKQMLKHFKVITNDFEMFQHLFLYFSSTHCVLHNVTHAVHSSIELRPNSITLSSSPAGRRPARDQIPFRLLARDQRNGISSEPVCDQVRAISTCRDSSNLSATGRKPGLRPGLRRGQRNGIQPLTYAGIARQIATMYLFLLGYELRILAQPMTGIFVSPCVIDRANRQRLFSSDPLLLDLS